MIDVRVPQHGMTMTEADIAEWLVDVGDDVVEGQAMVDIDTAKALLSIDAPAPGTVAEILAEVGETVPVDAVIARLDGKS